jgi:LacI family transcriptional regulator
MHRRVTLFDLAEALGISTGTVHRALHDHPGVSPVTRKRVLQMAKSMGYRPNLAARYLSRRRNLHISVNTLKGTTSFWDEVRAGIDDEAAALGMDTVGLEYRTYPRLGEGDEEAFEAALDNDTAGIIVFPSDPQRLRPWIRRAARLRIPVVCVVTDAPRTSRLAVVSIDTLVSGSLAADLMGRLLKGQGKVAVTLSSLEVTEHAEKFHAFETALHSYYPEMKVVPPAEDHDVESETFERGRRLIEDHPDLAGIYVTTEASTPILQAARAAGVLDRLTIITTDLFPALVEEIRSGVVVASIYQRPRTQGRMAFRVLHEFLAEGHCPTYQVALAPHLVMRGNLNFFLQQQTSEPMEREDQKLDTPPWEAGGHSFV